MAQTDQQLIEEFLNGSDLSFEILVKKYLKPVYNFIYHLMNDLGVVDDLTQITFLKAWKNVRRFDLEKDFKVWLFAIAKNTVYDYWKKKKTLPFALFENEDGSNKLENVAEDKILPDEVLMRMEMSGELETKLKLLNEKYRLILFMRYSNDFSLNEIAEILNLPYNTIKSRHKRALDALKKSFDKDLHL
jgi:RNA polymerase sigma-70 factor (ECF subfamily)